MILLSDYINNYTESLAKSISQRININKLEFENELVWYVLIVIGITLIKRMNIIVRHYCKRPNITLHIWEEPLIEIFLFTF